MSIFHFQKKQTQETSLEQPRRHRTFQAYGARYKLKELLLFEAIMSDFF